MSVTDYLSDLGVVSESVSASASAGSVIARVEVTATSREQADAIAKRLRGWGDDSGYAEITFENEAAPTSGGTPVQIIDDQGNVISDGTSKDDDGLGLPVVIGAAVGGAVLLAAAVVMGVLCKKRSDARKQQTVLARAVQDDLADANNHIGDENL